MGKYTRRSRDQKRKAKLKKRAERSRKHEPLAYHGSKYKTAAYVPLMFAAESAIHDIYQGSGGKLTDSVVEAALTELILRLRGESPVRASGADPRKDMIIITITSNWDMAFGDAVRFDLREQAGVLRTILGSLEYWRSRRGHGQGYVQYLEEFMAKARRPTIRIIHGMEDDEYGDDDYYDDDDYDDDYESAEGSDEDDDLDDMLLEIGGEWLDGERDAGAEFCDEMEGLLDDRDNERVLRICEAVLERAPGGPVSDRLRAFIARARGPIPSNTEQA